MAIPATGRSASFDAIMISRVARGRIAEIFALMDSMTLMQQLGVIPAPDVG
jgi:predicted ester cyclase